MTDRQTKQERLEYTMKKNRKSEENQCMTAEQIRELREQERMDSVYLEEPVAKKALYTAVNYAVAALTGAVILVALYYCNLLTGHLHSEILPHLYAVDDSAGFVNDLLACILNILLFAAIAVLFGFALDINYAGHGRPREAWGKYIKFILPAAFGSCLLYVVIHHIVTGGSFRVTGSIFSQILYYFTMIAVMPAANVLLYLVLPSAVIRMLLTVVSDTKERAELPLTLVSAAVMTFGMLGITPGHIENYGAAVFSFALIQSAACSLLYHRTNVIRYTILMYAGVSALYLALAALMNFFIK